LLKSTIFFNIGIFRIFSEWSVAVNFRSRIGVGAEESVQKIFKLDPE